MKGRRAQRGHSPGPPHRYPSGGPLSPLVSIAYLAAAVAAIAVYYVLPAEAEPRLYEVIGLSAVVGIVVGIRRNRPLPAAPWWCLAAGQTAFFVAGIVWHALDYAFPTIADGIYLVGYGFLLVGVWLLLRRRARAAAPGGWADALIVAGAVGVMVWEFGVEDSAGQILHSIGASVGVAYPVLGLLLLAVLARLMLAPGRRSTSYRIMVVSIGSITIADLGFTVAEANGYFNTASYIAGGWLFGYVALAAAALHPSMRTLSDSDERRERLTRGRVILLCLMAVAPLAVLIVGEASGPKTGLIEMVAAAVILFVAVVLRMAGLLREIERQGRELRARQEERGRLLDRTMRIAEDERRAVAADLHDGPIQKLTGLQLQLELAALRLERDDRTAATAVLDEAQGRLAGEIRSLRRMMTDLRPPVLSERGLEAALRDHLAAVGHHAGFAWSLEGVLSRELDADLETALYRIVQESLLNVVRHARARTVRVTVSNADGHVDLAIQDDGIGFEPERMSGSDQHFGLVAMRERARLVGGTLAIDSTPGRGTRVAITIPLPAPVDDAPSGVRR